MIERLDRHMARANAAYYATKNPFADFTTAPEMSQAFGEVLGAWCAVVWRSLAAPGPLRLIELGPGRGTLLRDATRAIASAGLAADIHVVETSERLRALLPATVRVHADLTTIPPGPFVLLANEFFDALPIRRFRREGGLWLERHVADGAPLDLPCTRTGDAAGGTIAETCDPALAVVAAIAARIASDRGAALLIDYGYATGSDDSLQAIANGEPADPYQTPGEADLTAHVDFNALARAAARPGVRVDGPVPQGPLLTALGLHRRADLLARTRPAAEAGAMLQAAQRLTEPHLMGSLFKVLALATPGVALPGIDP